MSGRDVGVGTQGTAQMASATEKNVAVSSRATCAASGACFFFSSRRRHTRCSRDWSSDVCSSDLAVPQVRRGVPHLGHGLPDQVCATDHAVTVDECLRLERQNAVDGVDERDRAPDLVDRKSTRLNSSHGYISYAVFCLKKKNNLLCWSRSTPHPHHRSRSGQPQPAVFPQPFYPIMPSLKRIRPAAGLNGMQCIYPYRSR